MNEENGTGDGWPDPSGEDGLADDPGRMRTPLEPGEVYELLANEYDRFVLYLLADRDRPIRLESIAKLAAAWATETPPALVRPEARRRARQRLHHGSIPRLEAHGVATVLGDPPRVVLTGDGAHLDPYLEFARARERRNVDSYLSATG